MDVWVQVEGRVCRRSLAVCKELVSDGGGRRSMESTRGQARGRAQGGGAGVLVAHVALAGMLDLFYLLVAVRRWRTAGFSWRELCLQPWGLPANLTISFLLITLR